MAIADNKQGQELQSYRDAFAHSETASNPEDLCFEAVDVYTASANDVKRRWIEGGAIEATFAGVLATGCSSQRMYFNLIHYIYGV